MTAPTFSVAMSALSSKLMAAVGQNFSQALHLPFGEVDAGLAIDGVLQGDGLGVLDVSGLALAQALVELVVDFLGALLRAQPAGDAFSRST